MAMTLTSVAKKANVAVMTASKVFNGDPTVRPYLRERVLTAARELGYRPNTLARGLRNKLSNIVTLGIQTMDNPYFGTLADRLSHLLMREGMAGVLCNNTGRIMETNQVACACGTILVAPTPDMVQEITESCHTLVTICAHVPQPALAPDISLDFAAAYRELATYLLAEGCGEVYFFCPKNEWQINFDYKFRYFVEEYAKHGGNLKVTRLYPGPDAAEFLLGRGKGRRYAVCASNDMHAAEIMASLQLRGIRVPEDVLVAGCDGTLVLENVCTLRADFDRLAQEAFDTLRLLLAGEDAGAGLTLGLELIKPQTPAI